MGSPACLARRRTMSRLSTQCGHPQERCGMGLSSNPCPAAPAVCGRLSPTKGMQWTRRWWPLSGSTLPSATPRYVRRLLHALPSLAWWRLDMPGEVWGRPWQGQERMHTGRARQLKSAGLDHDTTLLAGNVRWLSQP